LIDIPSFKPESFFQKKKAFPIENFIKLTAKAPIGVFPNSKDNSVPPLRKVVE